MKTKVFLLMITLFMSHSVIGEKLSYCDDTLLPLFSSVPSENSKFGLELNRDVLDFIRWEKPDDFSLDIPTADGGAVRLDLYKAPIFNSDLIITTSSGRQMDTNRIGVPYWGVVDGNRSSVFLFNEDNVLGSFYNGDAFFELHANEQSNSYDVVPVEDAEFETGCLTDTDISVEIEPIPEADEFTQNKPISIYLEINSEFPWLRSDDIDVLSAVVFTFNQSALLYKNEEISIKISEIFVWDTKSPYGASEIKGDRNNPNMYQFLSAFKKERTTFNGDIAMLFVELSSLGNGIAAKVGGLCDPNILNRMGVVKTYGDKGQYPNYSRGMEFFAHELGHFFGSVHTNQCAWNNNRTSLDNCQNKGQNCRSPEVDYTISEETFTIMSNCKKRSDFIKGLGVQPGNRIRNFIANATCLTVIDEWDKELSLHHLIARDAFEPYNAKYKAQTVHAYNDIHEDTKTTILATDAIYLKEGFHAEEDSEVDLKIYNETVTPSNFRIKKDNRVVVYTYSVYKTIEETLKNNSIESVTIFDASGKTIRKISNPNELRYINFPMFFNGFYKVEVNYIRNKD